MGGTTTTLAEVRQVALDLADQLEAAGAADAAGRLRLAASRRGADAECLLELRSALVTTRPAWEEMAGRPSRDEARRVLAAAKRLAIEL